MGHKLTNCAEGASFSATPGFQELVCVCSCVTDLSDFYEAHMRRPHPLFSLVIFQLGFSGIPENHEKTAKSYLQERSRRTLFWDPFFVTFFGKGPFFSARPGEGPASRFSLYQGRLRRNPARRVDLVNRYLTISYGFAQFLANAVGRIIISCI